MEPPLIIGLAVATFVTLWSLFATYRAQKRRRLLEALPTSATQGVFIGLVELKGTAESEAPLTTYLAEALAVHYTWSVDEHWERWETETYTDSDGKRKTRRVRKSGWSSVASGGDAQPFYLSDDTGAVQVRPDGAEVRGVSVFNRYCGRGDPLYYDKGPSRSITDSTHRRRFTESAIVLHEELYVVGKARERDDIVAAEVAAHQAAPIYLITHETEKQVRRRLGASAALWVLAGMVGSAGLGFVAAEELGLAIGLAIYLSIVGVARVVLMYNSMIDTRNRMRQGFSQIDIQLKRRADLLPNLASCVEGITAHERDVQTAIAEFRAEATTTGPGEAGANPTALVPKLRALAESYPILEADEHFRDLQGELIETEQRLALARGYFNDIATEWNNRVEQFPDLILAKVFRFRRQDLFEADDFERAAVDVEFAE